MMKLFFGKHLKFSQMLIRPYSNVGSRIQLSSEVKNALNLNLPIVALESTIITHGMPFPINLNTAIEVENIIRNEKCIPATIGILNGIIKIGMTKDELKYLADLAQSNNVVKTSRRDLSYVLSKNLNGGTTVAGTMILANMIGIKIFCTGGVGGVHRSGHITLDVSADLIELGRTPVTVVSSGIKSILDIPRTLEFLETQGVFVGTYKSDNNYFPAFYSRISESKVLYNFENTMEIAQLIKMNSELKLNSGNLIAVPIPKEYAMDHNEINSAIQDALNSAESKGITGKEVTPYLLSVISKITEGKSLHSNCGLIKNNAKVAAKIAKDLNQLENLKQPAKKIIKDSSSPIVIGGSILDVCMTVLDDNLKLNGATYNAKVEAHAGGVGRNIADGISKLFGKSIFLSAIGNDQNGSLLKSMIPDNCHNIFNIDPKYSSASCSVILDKFGDCKLVVGNMDIHSTISPEFIVTHKECIENAPIIIFDGNLPTDTMEKIFEINEKQLKPIFFEPTDVSIAEKPFKLNEKHFNQIKFISPNLYELRKMVQYLGLKLDNKIEKPICDNTIDEIFKEVERLGKFMNQFIENIIVTLGHHGIIMITKRKHSDLYYKDGKYVEIDGIGKTRGRFYSANHITSITNVSGAGDSFVTGFISAMLCSKSEDICINVGLKSATKALLSEGAVPEEYFEKTDKCFNTPAKYKELF